MKNIEPKLIKLFKQGYCTPQIARIAKKIDEPSTTIHYNIKKLEKVGAIKAYKAVFDHKKIDEGFCAYVLVNVSPDEYGIPEKLADDISKHKNVESVDVLAGNWELIVKIRARDQNEFYDVLKNILSRRGIQKSTSLITLKQVKTNFVSL